MPSQPPELLTELLDHLVDTGLVRRGSAAGASELPKLLLDPRDGVPAPTADGGGAILGAFLTGGIRARPHEKAIRQDIVDIRIRATSVMRTWDLYRQLRGELIDKQAWSVGAREVLDSQEWRALQRLGSDTDGFSHIWAVLFITRA